VHVVEAIGSGLEALAKGNLTYRLEAEMTGSFAKLKDNFNAALVQLEDAMKSVLSGTDGIGVGPTKSRRLPMICRAAPSSRPPAWSRRPPRWKRLQQP